jgi:DNA-binding MarR family transcriptional regulator
MKVLESIKLNMTIEFELDVLPPSARVVYRVLKENDPMYIGEITKQSNYSRRTVQQALHLLEKSQLVNHYPDLRDLRRHKYKIVE